MRTQLELPNDVAAELAGPGRRGHEDARGPPRLRRLPARQRAHARRRRGRRRHGPRRWSASSTDLVRQGHEIAPGHDRGDHRRARPPREPEPHPRGRGLAPPRRCKVAPKTVNQKRYVDAIRRQTITVGIGPAGTGKSFLAVAMAVAALSRREVNRIVLTRPAVEAGERLGFLPGDVMAKVDPYLRPLFDALYDMLEPER